MHIYKEWHEVTPDDRKKGARMEKRTWGHQIWHAVKRLILILLILFCITVKASGSVPSEPVAAACQDK